MTDTHGAPIVVLHVDDDPDLRDLAATFLEREGSDLDVRTADSAEDGLDYLESEPIDCVVSDYQIPGTTGLEFLETVRESFPRLPFILFTGKGSEEIASEAISAGVTDYLQKETPPDQYAVLANRIENAVASSRTEAALRESEERYRAVVEGTHDAVYVYQDESFVFVNDRFCEILGYDADELRGMDVWELLHPDDHERVREIAVHRSEGDHDVSTYDARYETKNGDVRRGEFSVRETTYEGERAVTGSVRDVTRRKNRERTMESLHDATRRLMAAETRERVSELAVSAARDVLDLPRSSLWLTDDAGDLALVARTEEDRERATRVEAARSVVGTDETVVRDVESDPEGSEVVAPLGGRGLMVLGGESVTDFDVHYAQLLAANTDAALERAERETELKANQRELRRQNERLDEFASVVSHDLRNPLNVAQGYLDMYSATGDEPNLERVERAHDRMADIVDDVLTLARQGQTVSETEPVEGAAVVERAWASVETGEAELDVEWDDAVQADASRLQQLLENLLSNSVEHGSRGSDGVTIRVGGFGGGATAPSSTGGFFVADDGPGVPADEREAVFESGHSSDESGTGLGLTIVKQIAEAHGWSVAVTDAEGGGARFEFAGVERVGRVGELGGGRIEREG